MKKCLHQLIRNRQTVVMKSPDPVAGLYGYCEKQWHYLNRFEASCNRIAETLFICHAIEHASYPFVTICAALQDIFYA